MTARLTGSSGLGPSPGCGHCVVFLGKILNSHSALLHSGGLIGIDRFSVPGATCE